MDREIAELDLAKANYLITNITKTLERQFGDTGERALAFQKGERATTRPRTESNEQGGGSTNPPRPSSPAPPKPLPFLQSVVAERRGRQIQDLSTDALELNRAV